MDDLVTLDQIEDAARILQGVAVQTPLLGWDDSTWVKPEFLQPTGAFKIRGAYTKLARLPAAERSRGVIAYSSGNHAQAVARAAKLFGIEATIVMPDNAPRKKVNGVLRDGAEVVTCGPGSSQRRQIAEELAAKTGRALVPPYDDLDIISGQGTIGLEIARGLHDVTSVLVPVGGGGLCSGVAAAIKYTSPRTRVIGVEPVVAADARDSLRAGRIIAYSAEDVTRTMADGVRTQSLGVHTFAHLSRFLDDIVTVTEEEIAAATAALVLRRGLLVETSGALPLAAHLSGVAGSDERRVLVASGGNIEFDELSRIVQEYKTHPWIGVPVA
jgi:threonine dehydratase